MLTRSVFRKRRSVAGGRSSIVTYISYAHTAWMLGRAKRWVVGLLGPFIDRARYLESGQDHGWAGAYRVGFLSTLITRLTLRRFPAIGDDALGLVHAETWHRLLPNCACPIGERTLALSLAEDADFLEGCAAALYFESCLCGDQNLVARGMAGLPLPGDHVGSAPASLLDRWASTWDACLARSPATIA